MKKMKNPKRNKNQIGENVEGSVMTIKKRLFISNILMIIIPLVLSFFIAGIVMNLFPLETSLDGKKDLQKDDHFFHSMIKKTDLLVNDWSGQIDLQRMENDVEMFNHQYMNYQTTLSIYK